ncbi:non-specific lipid-transfer protein-like [Vicia villosa]|uniref:non-specific lipid-transfer protein-like n=1 Tax=Vicia villosa TaxID=3911 RepID=UPI00273A9C77|nr:non-specific lipid-transfer protein-like [Vicia villosa]
MSEKNYVSLFVSSVVVLGLLMTTLKANQIDDISCVTAIWYVMPCVPYLKDSAPGTPSSSCCAGVNNLLQKADTTQVRRNVCQCLKDASSKFGADSQKSKQLPQLCNITVSFPFDPKVDCNSIP